MIRVLIDYADSAAGENVIRSLVQGVDQLQQSLEIIAMVDGDTPAWLEEDEFAEIVTTVVTADSPIILDPDFNTKRIRTLTQHFLTIARIDLVLITNSVSLFHYLQGIGTMFPPELFLLPELPTLQQCFNKRAMYQLAGTLGIQVPRENPTGFPVFFKYAAGEGGFDSQRIDDAQGLEKALRKKVYMPGRKVPPWSEIINDTNLEPLVQEYLPGTEYTVDLLCDRSHKLVCCSPRSRDALSVNRSRSIRGTTVDASRFLEPVAKLCQAVNFVGAGCIQFKENALGELVFLEFNPRYAHGALLASTNGGVNLPLEQVRLMTEPDYVRDRPLTPVPGVTYIDRPPHRSRFQKDHFVSAAIAQLGTEEAETEKELAIKASLHAKLQEQLAARIAGQRPLTIIDTKKDYWGSRHCVSTIRPNLDGLERKRRQQEQQTAPQDSLPGLQPQPVYLSTFDGCLMMLEATSLKRTLRFNPKAAMAYCTVRSQQGWGKVVDVIVQAHQEDPEEPYYYRKAPIKLWRQPVLWVDGVGIFDLTNDSGFPRQYYDPLLIDNPAAWVNQKQLKRFTKLLDRTADQWQRWADRQARSNFIQLLPPGAHLQLDVPGTALFDYDEDEDNDLYHMDGWVLAAQGTERLWVSDDTLRDADILRFWVSDVSGSFIETLTPEAVQASEWLAAMVFSHTDGYFASLLAWAEENS